MFILLSLNYLWLLKWLRVSFLRPLTCPKTKGREGIHLFANRLFLTVCPAPCPAHTPSMNLGASSVHWMPCTLSLWALNTYEPLLPGSQYLYILKSQWWCHFFQEIFPTFPGGEAFLPCSPTECHVFFSIGQRLYDTLLTWSRWAVRPRRAGMYLVYH